MTEPSDDLKGPEAFEPPDTYDRMVAWQIAKGVPRGDAEEIAAIEFGLSDGCLVEVDEPGS